VVPDARSDSVKPLSNSNAPNDVTEKAGAQSQQQVATSAGTVSSTGAQEQGSAGEGSKNSQDDDAGKRVSVFDQLSDEDLALEVILRASKVGKWYTGTREYDTLMKNVVR